MTTGAPDPRIVEDLIERGALSMTRTAPRDDANAKDAIDRAADWLRLHARELRNHGATATIDRAEPQCPTP